MAIKFLIIAVLAIIFVEDLKSRSVHWFLFLFLTGFFAISRILAEPYQEIIADTIRNILFLGVQLVLISVYISVRNKALVNITRAHLGWGDIIFFVSISCYFSIINYIIFYIVSLTLSLLIWLIVKFIFPKNDDKHIPLAGLQASILSLLLLFSWWLYPVNLGSSEWFNQIYL